MYVCGAAGDVKQLHALGFDGVKLDGCGAQRNMTLYAELMKVCTHHAVRDSEQAFAKPTCTCYAC